MASELTASKIVKDNEEISVFRFNNALITPKRIEQIIQIDFPGNKAGKVTEYRLPNNLPNHLLVKSYTLDITQDDEDKLQATNFHVGSIPIVFFFLDINTNKIVRRMSTSFLGYPTTDFYLLFNTAWEIQVKCSAEFTSMSFYCEPIFVCHQLEAEVQ